MRCIITISIIASIACFWIPTCNIRALISKTATLMLDDAQPAKKRHIATKLLLRPGLKVLDIGSGWGGLGLMGVLGVKALLKRPCAHRPT
jgi:Mycolic acid cyclopropane synthetase